MNHFLKFRILSSVHHVNISHVPNVSQVPVPFAWKTISNFTFIYIYDTFQPTVKYQCRTSAKVMSNYMSSTLLGRTKAGLAFI